MTGRTLERLSAEDERILALEHGSVVGHWCKVLILDGTIDAARVCRAVEARLPFAPRLRQRLEMLPRGFGRPVWVTDRAFDVAWHVRPAGVPTPLDERGLRAFIAALMQQRLDRRRPLWRLDVVPLTGDRTALVWRVHHCMADGFTAMRIGADCIWTEEATAATAPPALGGVLPSAEARRQLLLAAALDRAAAGAREARALARDLAAVRHWRDGVARVRAVAVSARRELAPSPVASAFDAPLGRRRAIAWTAMPLSDLHAAAKRVGSGVTLNDAVVALIASGTAAWSARDAERSLPSLRVRIPVSLHGGAHAEASNRDSFIDVDVPLGEADVIERLRIINTETAARKAAHDADNVDRLLRAMAALPWGSHLVALTGGPHEFALCISNVVGPRTAVRVDGVPVSEIHSVVEVAQHHDLRASVISCGDRLSVCLCADADRVDPDVVIRGIEAAWEQLARITLPGPMVTKR